MHKLSCPELFKSFGYRIVLNTPMLKEHVITNVDLFVLQLQPTDISPISRFPILASK